jgi:hypothetical protein
MKPNFALNLTHDSIGLLHRTSRGWLEIGAAKLDAADLGDALTYLRRSALGLSPSGFATKLIIPSSQILYDRVWAPGPDDAAREAQIRTALEGRTPYAVQDLVFDWSGDGAEVDVAVVARETLDEAEQFAAQYKFNPVSFVAMPEGERFAGEPWFGPSRHSRNVLATGEHVERDLLPVAIISRAQNTASATPEPTVEAEAPEPAIEPVAEAAPPAAVETPAPEIPAPVIEPPEPVIVAAPVAEVAPSPEPDVAMVDAEPASIPQSQDSPRTGAPLDEVRADDAPFVALEEVVTEYPPSDSPPGSVSDKDAEAIPPVPAFSSRRRAEPELTRTPPPMTSAGAAPQAGPDRRPPAAAPTAARANGADAGISGRAAIAPTGAATGAATGAVTGTLIRETGTKAGKALSALVTAPSIPGLGALKLRKKPAPAPRSPSSKAAEAMPRDTGKAKTDPIGASPFAKGAVQRGKPRYLGLILTGALLFLLALVAAWSSYYLASGGPEEPSVAVAEADSTTPRPLARPIAPEPAPTGDQTAADAAPPLATAVDAVTTAEADAPLADPAAGLDAPLDAVPEVDEEMLADLQDPAEIAALRPEARPATAPAVVPEVAAEAGGTVAAGQDEIILSTMDSPPTEPATTPVPLAAVAPDAPPATPTPPPPFGTVYEFDENGLIRATAQGVVTPDGVTLIAGKPPRIPPERTTRASEETATTAAVPAEAATADAAPDQPIATFAADPALQAFRPRLRPASLTLPPGFVPATPAEDGAAAPDAPAPDAPAPDAPATDAPATAEPAEDGTALDIPAESRFASPRPKKRTSAILAKGEEARRATEAASLASAAAAAAAAAEAEEAALRAATEAAVQEAAAAEALAAQQAAQSPLAIAVSRKPKVRPKDLSRAVEAAAAVAVRVQPAEPQTQAAPEPEPQVQVAAAQPARRTPSPAPEPTILRSPEADDEPEIVGKAQRSVLSGTVAKQATFVNAINLSKINLIGVYGTEGKRYALVRESSGRYKKVKVGDRIDGGQIAAITSNEVRYQKGGRMLTLAMPKG